MRALFVAQICKLAQRGKAYRLISKHVCVDIRVARIVEGHEQAHLIAGIFNYLLKVRVYDMGGYRQVLAEKLSTLPHVANTSTYVARQAVKEDAAVSL